MQLYDMHSHLLPAFDDGAKTVEESLQLIECLKRQGVRNICLTPHFYTNEMSIEDFTEKRAEAFELFKPHIPDDVNIVLGAEVYVTHFLHSATNLSAITYGDSDYILTEFPYDATFGERTMRSLDFIMSNHGLTPVIPHVERYDYLMEHPHMIERLQSMGLLIQTNIRCYSDKAPFFRKRKLLKYISKGLIDILGSDAHSFRHNTPEDFEQALNTISEKCGAQTVERMMRCAAEIFNDAIE